MRRPRFRVLPRSLHTRLVLLFAVILVGAVSTYSIYTAQEQGEFAAGILQGHALSIAGHIAESADDAIDRHDGEALRRVLSHAAAIASVEAASLADTSGKVLAAVRRNADRQLVPEDAVTQLTVPDSEGRPPTARTETLAGSTAPILVAWSPVGANGVSGWVRTEQSLAAVERLRRHIVEDSILLGAGVMALAMLALALLLRRPMAALREAASFAARLDTDHGATLSQNASAHEVEQLRAALNRASTRLHHQHCALEASERRNGAILEASLDCVVSIDGEGLITEFNQAAEATFGYGREEILGRDLAELIVPARFRATHTEKVMARLQSGGDAMLRRRVEHSAVRKNGEEFPMELTIVPVEVGGHRWFTAYMRDISERRAAQQALALSEQRYRVVVENLNEIVFQTDVSGRWLYLNPAWTRTTLFPLPESLGKPVVDFVQTEDRERMGAAMEAVLAGRDASANIIVGYCAKDGGVRWGQASFLAERNGAGAIVGLAGSIVDVTERKRIEERLRDQLRFVRQLIEVIPSPIYIKNADGRFLGFNQAFSRFFGKRRRDFLGKTVFDLLPRPLAELHHARDQELLAHPGVVSFEGQVRDRSGQLKDQLHHKATYTRADGSTAGIVGIVTDISERKLFERELLAAKEAAEAASHAKSEFLANMSHEIRTPMNAIIGMTDLVLDSALEQEQREYLELVKSSADALLTIINDILDFSKIEAGRVDFENIGFNLRGCVTLAVRTIDSRAREKRLDLRWEIDPRIPDDVVGDPHRLRQVLLNLLGNAVKFTENGHVLLSVVPVDGARGALQFSVEDTGPGIAPDKQELIFDAFAQADASTTRRNGGTGLGLAICSRLVEGMGGRIWVESEIGAGSVFHFTARLGHPENVLPPAWDAAEPLSTPVRALIVAANPVSRSHLEALMRGWQFESVAASGPVDGAAALALWRSQYRPVNVILVDNPADQDAFATASALRHHAEDARTIVLTAAGLRGDAARCREHGVSAYLVHPVPDHDLREAIVMSLKGGTESSGGALITRHVLQERRRPLHVLVAENHPVNSRLTGRLLDKLGHRSTLAKDGQEAIALAQRGTFDAALLDLHMQGADGPAMARAIRSGEKGTGKRTPIFGLVEHDDVEARQRCLAAGMDDILPKPLPLTELTAAMDGVSAGKWAPAREAPAARPAAHAFDRKAVLENLGGDSEILEAIAGTFLAGYEANLAELQQAVSGSDWDAAYRSAHSIKGAAGNFCADCVTRAAQNTEAAARAKDQPLLAAEAVTLERDVRALAEALKLELATAPAGA